MAKRIAVLTGGGHVSCFHAGMYGIARKAEELGYEVIGFRSGFRGAVKKDYIPLRLGDIEPEKAGSMLGSTRDRADPEVVGKVMKDLNLSGLIVMGGNDHLGEASQLAAAGLPVMGWPKTMDNDLSVTYCTLGYITAAQKAAEMVRECHYDALTNERVHIITLFGRNTDWVVAAAAAWGSADLLIPSEKRPAEGGEEGYPIDFIMGKVQQAFEENGKRYGTRHAVVAVAEGADIDGLESQLNPDEIDKHGNIKIEPMKLALILKDAFKRQFGKKVPVGIDCLSYGMRNCPPAPMDRKLAEMAGLKCVEALEKGDEGVSSILVRQEGRVVIGTAPLHEVSVQRFMRPLNFIDYESMRPRQALVDYYRPLFGEPITKEEAIYRNAKYLLKQNG